MIGMNRVQRRALKHSVARAIRGSRGGLAHPVPDSVVLAGGPMDGWIVKPDAPALHSDWHTTWDVDVAPSLAGWRPGRYELAADGKRATWTEKLTGAVVRV